MLEIFDLLWYSGTLNVSNKFGAIHEIDGNV